MKKFLKINKLCSVGIGLFLQRISIYCVNNRFFTRTRLRSTIYHYVYGDSLMEVQYYVEKKNKFRNDDFDILE